MRLAALVILALAVAPGLVAEDGHPTAPPVAPPTAPPVQGPPIQAPPSMGGEFKAAMREVEVKIKAIKEQIVTTDPELAKLKTAAEEARKQYDLALEAKLKANPEYVTLKQQQDDLRQKRDAENAKAHDGK